MSLEKIILDENNCPVTATMKVLGGKWKIVLLHAISLGAPARFGDLKRSLKGITQTMLTLQLRELEEAGIIKRTIYAEVPPRVEYTLTDMGMSLTPILHELSKWGYAYGLIEPVKPRRNKQAVH